MEALLVYPENSKQLKSIKAVMVALNVRFEKKEDSPYDPEFVKKIKRGDDDILKGNTRKITLDEILNKDTTEYLMSNKANHERLSQALERSKCGEVEQSNKNEILKFVGILTKKDCDEMQKIIDTEFSKIEGE